VVYKIPCNSCDASYIGHRKFGTRISKHRNHIKSSNRNQSVITKYRLDFNHFNWENVQILDKERFLNKRLKSEMSHIYMQKNELNLKTDSECLHHSYVFLLDTFKQNWHSNFVIIDALSYIYVQCLLLSPCYIVTFTFK